MRLSNVCRLIGIPALVAVIALAVPVAHADVLVSSFFTDSVLRYDRTTGGSLGAFVAPGSGGLDGPIGLGFGPDGNLYTTSLPGSVLRYSGTTGVFVDTFVPSGSGGLVTPSALIFGPDSNLYVASSFVVGDVLGFGVLRYSGTTGAFTLRVSSPIACCATAGRQGPSSTSLSPPEAAGWTDLQR